MARNNSVVTRRLSRSEQAWHMRCAGKSLRTIGNELGCSHEEARRLLKAVYTRRTAELDEAVSDYKLEQIDLLDAVIEESQAAWEQSKRDAETDRTVTKKQGAKMDKPAPEPTGGETPENEPTGLYMNAATGDETTDEERAKLLGLVGMNPDGSQMLTIEETTTHTTAGQTGNPAHLKNLMDALKAKRELLGLDAPIRQEVTGAGGGAIAITEIVIEKPPVETEGG